MACHRWTEHDPEEIWASVTTCIDEALEAAEQAGTPVRVVAVGITNQRETTLLWDRRTGRPLHNAIVWLDTRTAGVCRRMTEQLDGGSVRLACHKLKCRFCGGVACSHMSTFRGGKTRGGCCTVASRNHSPFVLAPTTLCGFGRAACDTCTMADLQQQ